MRDICIVLISRTNYGRLKSVIQAIYNHPDLKPILIVAGSATLPGNGSLRDVIRSDGFQIDATLQSTVEGSSLETMAYSTGLLLLQLSSLLSYFRPDFVVTIGDRYEAMASAIASTYLNIPLVHIQGGEVTGTIDESIRHAVTKLAHIHFPATELSAERIKTLGEKDETVFMVGCPSIDRLVHISNPMSPEIKRSLKTLLPTIEFDSPYLILMQHPVTSELYDAAKQIECSLRALREIGIQTIVFSPNADAGGKIIYEIIKTYIDESGHLFNLIDNMSVDLFNSLLNNCACIVGNSSSAIREGAYLGVPAVNIGTRQNLRERGSNVIDVNYDQDEIKQAIIYQISHGRHEKSTLYGNGGSGDMIAKILATVNVPIQKASFSNGCV